jgi:hypothetical protein
VLLLRGGNTVMWGSGLPGSLTRMNLSSWIFAEPSLGAEMQDTRRRGFCYSRPSIFLFFAIIARFEIVSFYRMCFHKILIKYSIV